MPKRVTITIYLTPANQQLLGAAAMREDLTLSRFMIESAVIAAKLSPEAKSRREVSSQFVTRAEADAIMEDVRLLRIHADETDAGLIDVKDAVKKLTNKKEREFAG